MREMYEEAYNSSFVKAKCEEFVIFKGFKVMKDGSIYNVRCSDYYTSASKVDRFMFKKHGFVKGATLIVQKRDLKRINKLHHILSKLYNDKYSFSNKDIKKFGICVRDIDEMTNLLFFYKSRVKQVNEHLNL